MTRARAISLFPLSSSGDPTWMRRAECDRWRHFALSHQGAFWNFHRNQALSTDHQKKGRKIMDREHVKGAAEKAKGAIKDTAGKITGDKELQAEGKLDKAKGDVHNIAGDVKDAVRKAGK
jgi:uncharacterized protein YjbJ (UPF0337 family)